MAIRVRVLQISKAEISFLNFWEKQIEYLLISGLKMVKKHSKMLKQEDALKGLRVNKYLQEKREKEKIPYRNVTRKL